MPEPKEVVPQRVLLIRIGRLGDTILATPVIEALCKAIGSEVLIDFAASPGASAALLEMDNRINRVFPVAHRSIPWRIHPAKRELEKQSRDLPYDLVINLETGDECDDFIKFVHTKKFCGRPLIRPRHRAGRHSVDTEKTIYAELLGAEITSSADPSLQLAFEPQALPLAPGAEFVVLNPGFSGIQKPGYRSHRRWPDEYWQNIIDWLIRQYGVQVLINGAAEEQPYFAALVDQPGVHSLFGSSLPCLVTALMNAKCVISVDTGTMHLATALGTPVVALFGPTDPGLTGPYSGNVPYRVLTSGVDCQPCHQKNHQKQCMFNRCMFELQPEQVMEACEQIMRSCITPGEKGPS